MNAVVKTKFAVKPVVAALALAFSAVNAYADPTPIAQPGQGLIRGLTAGASFASNTTVATGFVVTGGGVVGQQIYDGYALSEIRLLSPTPYARGVIQWGKVPGTLELRNPAGFNVGQNAKLTFTTQAGVTDGAVLNIDVSGNQSQIFGLLESSATGDTAFFGVGTAGAPPSIFVANANGIIIGPLGHIVAPTGPLPGQQAGVGLIAADMNNANSINDFIANNNQVPAGALIPPGESYLNFTGPLGKIENMGGAIDGSTIANSPAQYVLLVGSTVINDGILFGKDIYISAGVSATNQKGTVNGVTNVTVNRYFRTEQAAPAVLVSNSLGVSAGTSEILAANAGGSFTNTGTVAANKIAGIGGFITVNAADGGISSGTVGDPDQLVGLFADSGIVLNARGPTMLANVVSGYLAGVTLPSLNINQNGGYGGDVHIEALTTGSQPSSVTTTGPVNISGANIVINSSINFQNGINTTNLNITSSKSLTTGVDGDLGAGVDININNNGAGGIDLSGDVDAGRNAGGGVATINNNKAGAPTTFNGNTIISHFVTGNYEGVNINVQGDLTSTAAFIAADDTVNITNNGKNFKTDLGGGLIFSESDDVNIGVIGPLDISAGILAGIDVNITQNSLAAGNTSTISGDVFAFSDINILNTGGSSTHLNVSGALTALDDVLILNGGNMMLATVNAGDTIFEVALGSKVWFNGPQTAGSVWEYHGPNASTKLLSSAVITAGSAVILEALHFQGVNMDGLPYLDSSEKPDAQIVSNLVLATLYGSMNAPIAGNTNWMLNQMQIAPFSTLAPILFTFSAVGGGFQAVNIGFTGDAFVSSGLTRTPFDTVGFVQSTLLPPPLVANGGSSLILQATGNLDVIGNGAPFLFAPNAFEFPGGVVLIAGGTLTSQVPIYNAWTTNAMEFQGIFKEGATIVDGSYNATNTNSWVNYSTYPVTGPGNSYRIVQSVPGLYQFVLDPLIVHHNAYSSVVVGGPTDFCPGGFAPYCP